MSLFGKIVSAVVSPVATIGKALPNNTVLSKVLVQADPVTGIRDVSVAGFETSTNTTIRLLTGKNNNPIRVSKKEPNSLLSKLSRDLQDRQEKKADTNKTSQAITKGTAVAGAVVGTVVPVVGIVSAGVNTGTALRDKVIEQKNIKAQQRQLEQDRQNQNLIDLSYSVGTGIYNPLNQTPNNIDMNNTKNHLLGALLYFPLKLKDSI